jgi:hypothetical protein
MKLIVAIIQPDKLDDVHQALIHAEIFRITVSRVTGHGQQEAQELSRGEGVRPALIPKGGLEIAANGGFVEPRSTPSWVPRSTGRARSGTARSSSCRSMRSSGSAPGNEAARRSSPNQERERVSPKAAG